MIPNLLETDNIERPAIGLITLNGSNAKAKARQIPEGRSWRDIDNNKDLEQQYKDAIRTQPSDCLSNYPLIPSETPSNT